MRFGLTRLPFIGGAALVTAAVLGACTGDLGDPPMPLTPPPSGPSCATIQPGDAPMRRLTRTEYDNTVRDLLGDTTNPAASFAPEEQQLGFDDQAAALTVSDLLAEQYMTAAEAISQRATQHAATLLGCDPEPDEDACARSFIASFAKRAFRRPPDAATLDRLEKLYETGKQTYDFTTGIQLVIQAALQSPRFLYRVEFGLPDAVAPGVVPLDDWEMASRLSYMLWNSMPDDELFAAAEAKELRTPEQIAAQAERMLDDPRAHDAVANFDAQWLGLYTLDGISKDPKVYPKYAPDLVPLFKQESLAFLDDVAFGEGGNFATMLTAPYSIMNARLAAFYGVKGGPEGDAWEKVALPPTERAGFLTQASILAAYAKPDQSSPVHRGKFVRERLLCQPLPPPPNNIVIVPPEVKPGVSTRERFTEHSASAFCSTCHHLMDPIGFGFEHYDGIGEYRTMDQGQPVDASGEIYDSVDADGPFVGAVQLAARLAGSDQVRQCYATEWFRFAYGRAETADDACSLARIQKGFADSGYKVKSLLVALTQTDAFRYRKAVTPGG
ncbi:MAG TPA: DUF1592 domain-containing protein [Minicystis sp.]|nr:DUF1592 domain-containing protein [Minicystis sp.]